MKRKEVEKLAKKVRSIYCNAEDGDRLDSVVRYVLRREARIRRECGKASVRK